MCPCQPTLGCSMENALMLSFSNLMVHSRLCSSITTLLIAVSLQSVPMILSLTFSVCVCVEVWYCRVCGDNVEGISLSYYEVIIHIYVYTCILYFPGIIIIMCTFYASASCRKSVGLHIDQQFFTIIVTTRLAISPISRIVPE